jgi:tRNA A-37 threonylcarbamoyl transferase component Bud32
MQHIHSKDVVHLNLNPNNILVLAQSVPDLFQDDPDLSAADTTSQTSGH